MGKKTIIVQERGRKKRDQSQGKGYTGRIAKKSWGGRRGEDASTMLLKCPQKSQKILLIWCWA